MAAFTFQDLITPATPEEVRAAIYRALAKTGVTTTSWGEGAVVRTMIIGVSHVIAALTRFQARVACAGFLDLSSKAWLTILAFYVYGVSRVEATAAAGFVTLTNNGGGVFDVDKGDLLVSHLTTGTSYRNDAAFHLGPNSAITIAVTATEAGSQTTATPNTIRTITTPPLTGVTCNNALALVGTDEERDPAVRARCKEKLGSLSPNGPWDAYAFIARSAKRAGGVPIGVTRTRIRKDGYGGLTLVVASASGPVGVPSDIAIIDDSVQRNVAPLSVTANVLDAESVVIPIAYELWAYNTSARTDDEIRATVAKHLAAFFAAQPVGGNLLAPTDTTGYVYRETIRAMIVNAAPEVYRVELASPAIDVALSPVQVATYTLGAQTIHQVAPPAGAAA